MVHATETKNGLYMKVKSVDKKSLTYSIDKNGRLKQSLALISLSVGVFYNSSTMSS